MAARWEIGSRNDVTKGIMSLGIMKKLLLAILATTALAACSDHTIDATPNVAIGFGNVATRAELSDLENNGFGVWAFMDNASVQNLLIMDNQKVTFDTSVNDWVYSPVRYWVDESLFHFVATYPYDANSEYYTLDAENKAVKLTVTETPSQVDYLMATNETDTNNAGYNTTVNLQFKHLLTSVGLQIWRDDVKHNADQMRVKSVTLSNISKGGTYTSETNLWSTNSDKVTVEKVYDEFSDTDNIGAAQVNVDGSLNTGGIPADPFGDMLFIPQTLSASNSVSLKIVYELKRQNAASWEEAELETILPDITWQPNRRYTYNVVLSSVTDITIYYIQTKVDPWGTPQVGGTVIIK